MCCLAYYIQKFILSRIRISDGPIENIHIIHCHNMRRCSRSLSFGTLSLVTRFEMFGKYPQRMKTGMSCSIPNS